MTINNIEMEALTCTDFIHGNFVDKVYWKVSGEVNGHKVFYTTRTEPKSIKEIKQELLWVYRMVTKG